MKQAVIFDFDGTLADSFDYVFDFLVKEAGNSRIYKPAERKTMRQMSMKRLALHLGVPVWRLPFVYFKGRRVMRTHMEHVLPFPGVDEMIRELHEAGYTLFVVSSNSSRNIRRLLKHQGLLDYFTAVRGGAGYTGKTPLIRQLLVRYNLRKRTTWYIGDETSDIVAATRAGVRSLAVMWGFANPQKLKQLEPTAYAEQVSDIPKILRAWKK